MTFRLSMPYKWKYSLLNGGQDMDKFKFSERYFMLSKKTPENSEFLFKIFLGPALAELYEILAQRVEAIEIPFCGKKNWLGLKIPQDIFYSQEAEVVKTLKLYSKIFYYQNEPRYTNSNKEIFFKILKSRYFFCCFVDTHTL